MKHSTIIWISVLIVFFACSKKEENEPFSPTSSIPKISLEKLTPTTVRQFESLTFHIKFTDGDGDIGNQDADVQALEILDTRDDILHSFHIPPQSPVKGIAITGVLVVELENLILLDQDNASEKAVFEIRLKDNKQNWSNTVESSPVSIVK
ncbi:MAG TPA: hypothetical protein DCX54_04975 [Flavobacteriales bacterium]|nr:hypothetical protein [Flavobacteriales bacterium]